MDRSQKRGNSRGNAQGTAHQKNPPTQGQRRRSKSTGAREIKREIYWEKKGERLPKEKKEIHL